MSAVVSGLIGGVVAALLTTYVAKRVGKAGAPGQLKYGPFLWVLGVACLGFALLPILSTLAGHNREFWAKFALTICFGLGGLYCLAEAALVRGSFNDEGIVFSTPWTGLKDERWKDLTAVEFNAWCYWYVLTFKSGKKIRLSQYLGGHVSALEMAEANSEL